jgi:hypothetical protein
MNHVHVQPPKKTDTVMTRDGDRLFAQFQCWDFTKSTTLAFRAKAMLQLAQLDDGQEAEYRELLANDELRHSLLASLRVRVKKNAASAKADAAEQSESPQKDAVTENSEGSQASNANSLSIVVVEAAGCSMTDIPNDSLDAIHGLLACQPKTSDRLAAVQLDMLKTSPFYNMLTDTEPADKALALLYFTQRANGKQLQHGFRLVAERVEDATNREDEKQYATVTLCTVEKAPDFTAGKNATALAIISKVIAPSKPQHTADLYIEALEIVPDHKKAEAIAMMKQLQRVSALNRGDANTSTEAAWAQRKCRRLLRYPTQS